MDRMKAAIAANVAMAIATKRIMEGGRPPLWTRTAWPYLKAIKHNDYGAEDPEMCVLYALNNMTGWKGPIARDIKNMLNDSIKADTAEGVTK